MPSEIMISEALLYKSCRGSAVMLITISLLYDMLLPPLHGMGYRKVSEGMYEVTEVTEVERTNCGWL